MSPTPPLIACKQLNPALLDNRLKPLRFHPEFEFDDLRFVEAFQSFDVERSRDVAYREMGPRRDTVDSPGLLADDGRGGLKGDPYVSERLVGRILDTDFLDDRNIVLRRSEIDPTQRAMSQRYDRRFCVLVRCFDVVVTVWQFSPPKLVLRRPLD